MISQKSHEHCGPTLLRCTLKLQKEKQFTQVEYRLYSDLVYVRFQVLTAASMRIRAFWYTAQCSLVVVD
jgi:hypothetical protein